MKPQIFLPALIMLALLSSCELAGTIFKGGMWTGIILVLLVLGLIMYFFSRGKK